MNPALRGLLRQAARTSSAFVEKISSSSLNFLKRLGAQLAEVAVQAF